MSAKPLLVGELNSCLAPDAYLREYDRANLCAGRWSAASASAAAAEISRSGAPAIVLLGAKVCAAFGLDYEPFTARYLASPRLVVLPHPSGRCRAWNEAAAVDRARAALRVAGCPLGDTPGRNLENPQRTVCA
jgi:hypothetical protein